MREIRATADVHMEAGDHDPRPFGAAHHVGDVGMPDAMLRALAAGVCLLAVTVAEAGIHAERDLGPRHPRGELLEHVGRAAVDMDAQARDLVEGIAVEDVGGVDDRVDRRQAVG